MTNVKNCVDKWIEMDCRLRDNLTSIDIGESGFSIDKHLACIAHTCAEATADSTKSTLGIKAREHYNLMMVRLPFCSFVVCFYFCKFLLWWIVPGIAVFNAKPHRAGASQDEPAASRTSPSARAVSRRISGSVQQVRCHLGAVCILVFFGQAAKAHGILDSEGSSRWRTVTDVPERSIPESGRYNPVWFQIFVFLFCLQIMQSVQVRLWTGTSRSSTPFDTFPGCWSCLDAGKTVLRR